MQVEGRIRRSTVSIPPSLVRLANGLEGVAWHLRVTRQTWHEMLAVPPPGLAMAWQL